MNKPKVIIHIERVGCKYTAEERLRRFRLGLDYPRFELLELSGTVTEKRAVKDEYYLQYSM